MRYILMLSLVFALSGCALLGDSGTRSAEQRAAEEAARLEAERIEAERAEAERIAEAQRELTRLEEERRDHFPFRGGSQHRHRH